MPRIVAFDSAEGRKEGKKEGRKEGRREGVAFIRRSE